MGDVVRPVSAARRGSSAGAIPTPTPMPFGNCTLLPFVRIVVVSSYSLVFVCLQVVHWTKWFSA